MWKGGSSPHEPCHVRPGSGPTAELATAHDLGADVCCRLLDDGAARVLLAALQGVTRAPGAAVAASPSWFSKLSLGPATWPSADTEM
jgi:hypothetical protein